MNCIFFQLLIALLLSALLQYRILEHQVQEEKQQRVPIEARYLDITNRVRMVDQQLRQLASHHSLVRVTANATAVKDIAGPTMKTAQQLARAAELSIDVSRPCGDKHGNDLTLLVIVYNRAQDFERREVIRQTYGSALKRHPKTAIYFIVARGPDAVLQKRLEQEAHQFDDIIQVDYLEEYYNCTVKGVALVRWTALRCPFAKFVLKFDDDSFLRLKPILAELEKLQATHIIGLLSSLDEVIRQNSSKWFIDELYYPKLFYPSYIRGAYLIPAREAVRLYEAIVAEPVQRSVPALPFDDVYITGILAAKATIPRSFGESFILINELNKDNFPLLAKYNVHFNYLSPDRLYQYWQVFGDN